MEPRVVLLNEKKLVGMRLSMSLSDNKVGVLWGGLMRRRGEISNCMSSDLISMAVYGSSYFVEFNPDTAFEKWAAVEVVDFELVPYGMEAFTLLGGLYAVFDYKGSSADPSIFHSIFGVWLPGSMYVLDDRPHFEVLGSNYKNADPDSEEEIWIPIRLKG